MAAHDNGEDVTGQPCSWTPEESEVESYEHQDNANIHCQPFQESISEEHEIYTDYGGYHRHHVKHDSYLSAHFRLVASSATTSTPVTASPSLTSAPSTVAATTSTTTTFTWPGFIDYHVAAHEILAVEGLDNAGRFFIVVDFNEGEPARLSRELVCYQAHARSCCTRRVNQLLISSSVA
jgi:hypothetical protein